MPKTILIGVNNNFGNKTNKWLFCSLGLIFLLNATINLSRPLLFPLSNILSILFLLMGVGCIIYGLTGFSPNSKYAPKVKIDEEGIEWGRSFWKPVKRLSWPSITGIEFQPYGIVFYHDSRSSMFSYNTTSAISIEIKQAILDMAERKNIEVAGG